MSESPNDGGESPSVNTNSYKYTPVRQSRASYSSGESPTDAGESPSEKITKSYVAPPMVPPKKTKHTRYIL